jgi:hypothetical protein
LILEAKNDEMLLWQAIAAQARGNGRELEGLAHEFLRAETAKDRALGITLLAFSYDDSTSRLQDSITSDSSFWVRDHAEWGLQVRATEQSCEAKYREVLSSQSLPEMSAALAELMPALTPMSQAWYPMIEQEFGWPKGDRRMEVYLGSFWYHWNSLRSHREDVSICGRKLREYCRGERLKDGLTTRQAPWWSLERVTP